MAELANLQLAPDEAARMLTDLNNILGYVAEMAEVDTADVPPMEAGIPTLDDDARDDGEGSREALRVDALRPSLDRTAVMREAPASDGVYFKVPKVIER